MPPDRPRVLFVGSFPPPVTGQTVATRTFRDALAEVARVEVFDLADPGRHQRASGAPSLGQLRRVLDLRRRILASGLVDVGYLTVASSFLGRLRDVVLARALRRRARRLVVHAHQGDFVSGSRGMAGLATRLLLAPGVDRVILLSRTFARDAEWLEAERVRVVANPPGADVDVDDADLAGTRAARDADTGFRVLFLANCAQGKGHHRLLEALPLIRLGLPPERRLRATFVGAWPSEAAREAFLARVGALGLGDQVDVEGEVRDRSRVKAYLSTAHVLAFPSTYRREGLPLAAIEALSAGTPVVASTHAALPEVVRSGESGRLLERLDPPSLAGALLEAADRDTWQRWSAGARALYEERFQPHGIRDRFIEAVLDWEDEP